MPVDDWVRAFAQNKWQGYVFTRPEYRETVYQASNIPLAYLTLAGGRRATVKSGNLHVLPNRGPLVALNYHIIYNATISQKKSKGKVGNGSFWIKLDHLRSMLHIRNYP